MWFSKKSSPQPAGAAVAPAVVPISSSVTGWLRATVARLSRDHLPPDAIDVRAHLLDSGYVDSLSSTELLTGIERQFGVRIDEMDIVGRLCNIEALAREIESRANGAAR
jgi:acyl carrier protein